MIQYPLQFTVHAQATSGSASTWETWADAHPEPVVMMAIPPEFQGPGGGLSPEDLYAMALQNCYVATFKVFAEKSKFDFSKITARALLDVDRNSEGRPMMARVRFTIRLEGVEKVQAAERLLEKVSQNCMILNSVVTDKTFNYEVVETAR